MGPEVELKRWLKALRRLDACPLTEDDIDRIRFNPGSSGSLLSRGEADAWELNPQHVLIREIERHGNVLRHMPYLTSVFLSSLNRALP